MNRTPKLIAAAVCAVGALTSCSAHHASTEAEPATLAAVHADLRLVRGETTWVAHGHGYELVGRTRGDLAAIQPALDRSAAFLAQIYPVDSVAPIIATIRRAPTPGKPFVTAAPVPTDVKGAQVELVIVDPKAMEEERKKNQGPSAGMIMAMRGGATTPAARAWLSARASHLTGTAARLDQSRGEADDPRVPAWAIEMLDGAGNDAAIDNDTKLLAAHSESLIPLSRYFTMEQPGGMEAGGRRGGSTGGESPPEGRSGGTGGMGGGRGGMGGGRGGMGGGRGGMGGGGNPGGRGGRSGSGERPLEGFALYAAQSAVLTKYFARSGSEIVGQMIDAQIMGKQVDDVMAAHNMGTFQQLDADWRSWLTERADVLTHR